jgi:hypothetical protein
LVALDASTGQTHVRWRYDPPEALRVAAKGLTGLAWAATPGRSDLFVASANAVHRLAPDGLRWLGSLHRPHFNDLHGLSTSDGRLQVTNTGLDAVDTFDLDGAFLGQVGFEASWLAAERIAGRVPDRATWRRLHTEGFRSGSELHFEPDAPAGDYYRADASAPFCVRQQRDFVHPNHATLNDGRLWVTSLARQALIEAGTWRVRATFEAPPHDGIVCGEELWFTRVDGVVEARSRANPNDIKARIDVSMISGVTGWCRGIHVTPEAIWVGFTAIRQRPGHPWDRGALADTRTAVVVLRRRPLSVSHIFDLSDPTRHVKVFALAAACAL